MDNADIHKGLVAVVGELHGMGLSTDTVAEAFVQAAIVLRGETHGIETVAPWLAEWAAKVALAALPADGVRQ